MHVSLIPWMVRDVFFQMVLANWKNKLKLHESSYCLLSCVSEIMSLTIAGCCYINRAIRSKLTSTVIRPCLDNLYS